MGKLRRARGQAKSTCRANRDERRPGSCWSRRSPFSADAGFVLSQSTTPLLHWVRFGRETGLSRCENVSPSLFRRSAGCRSQRSELGGWALALRHLSNCRLHLHLHPPPHAQCRTAVPREVSRARAMRSEMAGSRRVICEKPRCGESHLRPGWA